MELSEAIRLGAMLKPQGRGNGSSYIDAESLCALEAAKAALGIQGYEFAPVKLVQAFPILWLALDCTNRPTVAMVPPQGAYYLEDMRDVASAIWILNDNYGWTRERIADWVATIEARHPEFCPPDEELAPPSVPIYEEPDEVVAERIADKIIAEALESRVPRFAVELSPLDVFELEVA